MVASHRAFAVACLCLALTSPLLAAAPATVSIEADVVQLDLNLEQTQALGNARLSYGDLQLRADEITADRSAGRVQATGGLAITESGRTLSGETLQYSFQEDRGVLTSARVAEQGVIIHGERIEFSPREVVAHNAYFTTCDRPHPHYTFGARRISLTAQQPEAGGEPTSGRLSLDRARVTYHGRSLFTVPRYSVPVGQLGEPGATPLPTSGFSRDDGPYSAIAYTLGGPGDSSSGQLSYRYTTLRGIRGFLRAQTQVGPAELTAAYVRRDDPSERELRPDEIEASLANVLVNRYPEYGVRLPDLPIGRSLRLRAEWMRGSYSELLPFEREVRARGDRVSTSALLSVDPYRVGRKLTVSHAVGWRRSSYSPGDSLAIQFVRHSLDLAPSPDRALSLSYLARRSDGESPFLFDQAGVGRELLAELRWRAGPRWRLRLVGSYDLQEGSNRDSIISVTRSVHCLDYTFGWRKTRGTFFIGIGLARPTAAEVQP